MANMKGFIEGKKDLPLNGKKTKGRVRINMEFIHNKLRRYTTFSKRKTGIMKKAYELATLTGTQVMLLVASETGHVYTYATNKLKPMILSEAGRALIQTCLNSPDNDNLLTSVVNGGTTNSNGQNQNNNPATLGSSSINNNNNNSEMNHANQHSSGTDSNKGLCMGASGGPLISNQSSDSSNTWPGIENMQATSASTTQPQQSSGQRHFGGTASNTNAPTSTVTSATQNASSTSSASLSSNTSSSSPSSSLSSSSSSSLANIATATPSTAGSTTSTTTTLSSATSILTSPSAGSSSAAAAAQQTNSIATNRSSSGLIVTNGATTTTTTSPSSATTTTTTSSTNATTDQRISATGFETPKLTGYSINDDLNDRMNINFSDDSMLAATFTTSNLASGCNQLRHGSNQLKVIPYMGLDDDEEDDDDELDDDEDDDENLRFRDMNDDDLSSKHREDIRPRQMDTVRGYNGLNSSPASDSTSSFGSSNQQQRQQSPTYRLPMGSSHFDNLLLGGASAASSPLLVSSNDLLSSPDLHAPLSVGPTSSSSSSPHTSCSLAATTSPAFSSITTTTAALNNNTPALSIEDARISSTSSQHQLHLSRKPQHMDRSMHDNQHLHRNECNQHHHPQQQHPNHHNIVMMTHQQQQDLHNNHSHNPFHNQLLNHDNIGHHLPNSTGTLPPFCTL